MAAQGVWAPQKIANPDYFMDETPLRNLGRIGGAAIEIWTMDEGYYFSNIYIGSDESKAASYREQYWTPKKGVEVPPHGFVRAHGTVYLKT